MVAFLLSGVFVVFFLTVYPFYKSESAGRPMIAAARLFSGVFMRPG
jgi:hypothetical protein